MQTPAKNWSLIASSSRQVGSRKSGCLVIPGLLELVVPSPKTKQQMETHTGFKSAKPLSHTQHFQDGYPGDNQSIPTKRGMGIYHWISATHTSTFPSIKGHKNT